MTSKTTNKFSPEVRARAVRMVAEHPSRWAAVSSIAAKIGCSAHTLNEWVKKSEVDSGNRRTAHEGNGSSGHHSRQARPDYSHGSADLVGQAPREKSLPRPSPASISRMEETLG